MSSALQMLSFLTLLLVGLGSGAISPLLHDQAKDKPTEAPWQPATQPREHGYNVMDGIQGANQLRHETWKNGTMTGMYALPTADGQYQIINYIADDQGFRITSTDVVSASQLSGGHSAPNQTAEVDIDRDGEKTNYKLKASEIGQKQKQKQQQQENLKGHPDAFN